MRRGFDRLARPYRWMEYATFGRALERCREHFLPTLHATRHALLLGDGDGRFAASLLRAVPSVKIVAADSSAAMLAALNNRCQRAGAEGRVVVHCADLTGPLPTEMERQRFDLLCTHFFLDCLSEAEIESLAVQLRPLLTRDARWVVSEFNVPDSKLQVPARLLIRSLYVAFGMLTGLRTREMPRYGAVLEKCGFCRVQQVVQLHGLLVAEVWKAADHKPVTAAA